MNRSLYCRNYDARLCFNFLMTDHCRCLDFLIDGLARFVHLVDYHHAGCLRSSHVTMLISCWKVCPWQRKMSPLRWMQCSTSQGGPTSEMCAYLSGEPQQQDDLSSCLQHGSFAAYSCDMWSNGHICMFLCCAVLCLLAWTSDLAAKKDTWTALLTGSGS